METCDLLNGQLFETSQELAAAWGDIQAAIAKTDWPYGSGKFTIYPESGKASGKGNGVKPIKVPCIAELSVRGWQTESLPNIDGKILTSGDLDALRETASGYILFEWETGNVSSSHRAINKLLMAMQETNILGGFLVVPSDQLKRYLTDRIGNIGELRCYFPLWSSLPKINGALRIVVVEHDATSLAVQKIPKGTDGHSAYGRTRAIAKKRARARTKRKS